MPGRAVTLSIEIRQRISAARGGFLIAGLKEGLRRSARQPSPGWRDGLHGYPETALNIVVVAQHKDIAIELNIGQLLIVADIGKAGNVPPRLAWQRPVWHFFLDPASTPATYWNCCDDGFSVQNDDRTGESFSNKPRAIRRRIEKRRSLFLIEIHPFDSSRIGNKVQMAGGIEIGVERMPTCH